MKFNNKKTKSFFRVHSNIIKQSFFQKNQNNKSFLALNVLHLPTKKKAHDTSKKHLYY